MNEKTDEITKLLLKLQEAGATIKTNDKNGAAFTEKIIADLNNDITPQFDAWVSWTKAI